jgi:hypothetical protein
MSRSTNEIEPGPNVLEDGRVLARITRRELWLRYLGLGGDASPAEFHDYLEDARTPNRREYNLLAHALNERLMDVGLFERLAYVA